MNKDIREKQSNIANVTKQTDTQLNTIESRVKEVFEDISYDESFKDSLSKKLETTIVNLKKGSQMENTNSNKKAKRDFIRWPLWAVSFVGAFTLIVFGLISIYQQQVQKPEVKYSDPGITLDNKIKKLSTEYMDFDIISPSFFREKVHECYYKCSAEELVQKAIETNKEIDSYKVLYTYNAEPVFRYVTGYQNLHMKARYLESNVSFESPHTREEVITGSDQKLVRLFDENGKWISNNWETENVKMEPFGLDNALDILDKDNGWVVDSYEVIKRTDSNLTLTLKGHSSSTTYTFDTVIDMLPNLYISSVNTTFKNNGTDFLEEHTYKYSDFDRSYSIYSPKQVMADLFDHYPTAEDLYGHIYQEVSKFNKGSYMVVYKSDRDILTHSKAYVYKTLNNPGEIDFNYAQYTNDTTRGLQQEVYIANKKHTRNYNEASATWSEWETMTSDQGWEDLEFARFYKTEVLNEYVQNNDWSIEKYEIENGISDYQKIVVVTCEGVDKNEGRRAEIKITVSATNDIDRIEALVTKDGKYEYRSTFDYFMRGYSYEDYVEDPEGVLKESYDKLRPNVHPDYILNELDERGMKNCSGIHIGIKSKIPVGWGCSVSDMSSGDRVYQSLVIYPSAGSSFVLVISDFPSLLACEKYDYALNMGSPCYKTEFYSNALVDMFYHFAEGQEEGIYGTIKGESDTDVWIYINYENAEDKDKYIDTALKIVDSIKLDF